MGVRLTSGRFLAPIFLFGFMAAVAGCKSGDASTALDPGTSAGVSTTGASAEGTTSSTQAPEGKVLQSELRAYCPGVTLKDGSTFRNAYEKGGQDDPNKLIYQSSITAV